MFRLLQVPALNTLVFLISSYAIAQSSATVTEYSSIREVERTIASGDVHAYALKLTQGQILRLALST